MNTREKHEVPSKLLENLLANHSEPEDWIGENGLLKQLPRSWLRRLWTPR